jgi:hypothetical protein
MKKILLIVVLVILVVIVGGFGYLYMNRAKIMNFALEKGLPQIENMVVANLPAGESKEQVHHEFEKALANFKAGKYDEKELQTLLLNFQTAIKDKKLDTDEVKQLLESVRKLSK